MITNLTNVLDRDLVFLHKGDSMPVAIVDDLAIRGWLGGEFLRWVDAGTGMPTVDIADGRYCGFAGFGSAETGDQYTAMVTQNIVYDYVNLFFGGNYIYTRTYERYGYLYRHGLGPMVPLVYAANQALYISENGQITNEDESDFAIFPPHTFPDGTPILVRFVFFGVCSVPPQAGSKYYIGCQTNFGV